MERGRFVKSKVKLEEVMFGGIPSVNVRPAPADAESFQTNTALLTKLSTQEPHTL